MLSLYSPFQILLNNVFPKESSIWFVVLVVDLKSIYETFWTSMLYCFRPLVQFSQEIAQRSTQPGWWNACCLYFWHLKCLRNCWLWLAVFTVLRSGKDGFIDFKISGKHRKLALVFSLLVRLIWFCETAKLSNFVFSNNKRMT